MPRNTHVDKHEAASLLFRALGNPSATDTFTEDEWDLFLRVARNEGLLARIVTRLSRDSGYSGVPATAADHMDAARRISADHERMIRWEVDRIQHALAPHKIPLMLLKGAAYLMADLALARGRLVSDVDILVPEDSIEQAEAALLAAGWQHLKLNPYDQRYYRRWMHELPPLRHQSRGTIVDVHHRIVPPTSRISLKPEPLWSASVTLENTQLRVLSPEDMLLHCAIHLFHDGDLDHGLRDLVDLHDMFKEFGRNPVFWDSLVTRARELAVTRPLFYSMRYCSKLLGTQIPQEAHAAIRTAAPAWPVLRLMDLLVCRALTPDHPDHPSTGMALASWMLYVRSHYLRMPLRLLVPHLLKKSFRGKLQAA